jgi:hypothetical protein
MYTGLGLVRISCRLSSGDNSVVLLHWSLVVPILRNSLYSWNSVKSRGPFALINYHDLQVIHKIDRCVVIHTFQTSNDFVLDLVLSESRCL